MTYSTQAALNAKTVHGRHRFPFAGIITFPQEIDRLLFLLDFWLQCDRRGITEAKVSFHFGDGLLLLALSIRRSCSKKPSALEMSDEQARELRWSSWLCVCVEFGGKFWIDCDSFEEMAIFLGILAKTDVSLSGYLILVILDYQESKVPNRIRDLVDIIEMMQMMKMMFHCSINLGTLNSRLKSDTDLKYSRYRLRQD